MSQPAFRSDECLLVATRIEAFVVGADAQELYDLATVPRTQQKLEKWHFSTQNFLPFTTEKLAPLQAGVHLHWTLPVVFMHSVHKGPQTAEQPLLPNRWLVVRVWHAADANTFSSKAWIVESDYVTADPNSNGSPFPFFESTPPSALNGNRLGYVGRVVDAAVWKEAHPQYRFALKSTGWGDPSFAGYYPACRGVLGFWDAMEGVADGSLLTYLVMGWYSDPAQDLLRSSPFKEQLDGSSKHTLCHGGVVDLTWQGAKQRYPAAPNGTTTRVAIGGSAAEALSALVAPDNPDLQRVLCAFQHGQADQVAEPYQLTDLLHRHAFTAAPGGKRWTLEPVDRGSDAQPLPPPLSSNVQNLLRQLNDAQQALDRHMRELESLRSRLFACWVTWGSKQTGPPARRPSRDVMKSAETEFQAAKAGQREREDEVGRCRTAVDAALKVEQTGMRLAESTMPPFLQPKDPFVVLDGEQPMGMDGVGPERSDESRIEAISRGRGAQDVLSGVRQGVDTWLAKDSFTVPIPDAIPLNELTRLLLFELLLLDPNCSRLLDPTGKRLERDLFRTLQDSLDQTAHASGITLEWLGQRPDDVAVTRWTGNSWRPLYLMWQAYWTPTYERQTSPSPHGSALAGWKIDPDEDAAVLMPQTTLGEIVTDMALQGATIISPLSGRALAASISRFVEAAWPGARLDRLNSLDETIGVGQSLGGLNELLLRQALGLFVPPLDPVWDTIERVPQSSVPIPSTLFPVRAGALKIVNLWIVDAFGQTRKVLGSTQSPPQIITSYALRPPSPAYHMALSPRLAQPARLNFDCGPPDSIGTSPVCGWLVPNFLDKSFIIFSAQGEPLGALESVLPALGEKTISSKVTFNWRPIPGSTLAISGIGNEWLRRFLDLVTQFSADEGQAFLELIDLVLRKTDGRLPPEDAAMTVLLGRPLALVRASVALELQGLPAGYWNTHQTAWKFETEGFEKVQVPVRLGGMRVPADGLVGYLTANNVQSFFACQQAIRRVSSSSRIQYDGVVPIAASDPPVSLTLLMDVSAKVHASTGILPRCVLDLPSEVSKQATLLEEVYFSAAPVLDESAGTTAQLTMPRPSDAFGQWSWSTRPATGWHEIRPADDRARFAGQVTLSEGWLKLRLRRNDGSTANG
ncbi:MAG: hypothetical protein ACREQZ_06530 [Woeseiaceae bacterium]